MIHAYHQPTAVEDAIALVARGAVPVAGATGLYAGGCRRDAELVDVTGLGLAGIEIHDDRIAIGATTPLQALATNEALPGMEGALLRRCARQVASRPLRNMITAGGNVAHMVYWADLPVVLLALDGAVEVRVGAAPARQVPIAEVMRVGKQAWDGGLITRIVVPRRNGRFSFGYERMTRTATDYSLSTVCATARYDDGVLRDVLFAVGAVTARPTRMPSVEAALEGRAIDDASVGKAVEALASDLTVAPNFRAPADYRRDLTIVLARRALVTMRVWATRGEE